MTAGPATSRAPGPAARRAGRPPETLLFTGADLEEAVAAAVDELGADVDVKAARSVKQGLRGTDARRGAGRPPAVGAPSAAAAVRAARAAGIGPPPHARRRRPGGVHARRAARQRRGRGGGVPPRGDRRAAPARAAERRPFEPPQLAGNPSFAAEFAAAFPAALAAARATEGEQPESDGREFGEGSIARPGAPSPAAPRSSRPARPRPARLPGLPGPVRVHGVHRGRLHRAGPRGAAPRARGDRRGPGDSLVAPEALSAGFQPTPHPALDLLDDAPTEDLPIVVAARALDASPGPAPARRRGTGPLPRRVARHRPVRSPSSLPPSRAGRVPLPARRATGRPVALQGRPADRGVESDPAARARRAGDRARGAAGRGARGRPALAGRPHRRHHRDRPRPGRTAPPPT